MVDIIKTKCSNCGNKAEIKRPFGMNKYLEEMTYSKCPKCLKNE